MLLGTPAICQSSGEKRSVADPHLPSRRLADRRYVGGKFVCLGLGLVGDCFLLTLGLPAGSEVNIVPSGVACTTCTIGETTAFPTAFTPSADAPTALEVPSRTLSRAWGIPVRCTHLSTRWR